MAGEPELQQGESGDWVQYLQQTLAHYGYWSGGEDGQFGAELAQAVQQFQSAYSLTADGVVRQDTWDVLTGATNQSGGNGSAAADGQQEGIHIDLSEIPAIYELSQYEASEAGADQYLASMGIERPSDSADADSGSAYA